MLSKHVVAVLQVSAEHRVGAEHRVATDNAQKEFLVGEVSRPRVASPVIEQACYLPGGRQLS